MIDLLNAALAKTPEGFTLTVEGEPVPADLTGLMIGGRIPEFTVPVGTDLSVAPGLPAWLTAVREDAAPYIGGWVDGDTLYLDAVDVWESHENANLVARARKQKAYGEYVNGEYVKTWTILPAERKAY